MSASWHQWWNGRPPPHRSSWWYLSQVYSKSLDGSIHILTTDEGGDVSSESHPGLYGGHIDQKDSIPLHGAKEGNSPPADGSQERREGANKKVSPSKNETIRLRMGRLAPPRLGIEPSSPAWQAGILTDILTRPDHGTVFVPNPSCRRRTPKRIYTSPNCVNSLTILCEGDGQSWVGESPWDVG